MEQAGVIHTLAEPNLTAISGETATFLAGGEFPVLNGFSCSTATTAEGTENALLLVVGYTDSTGSEDLNQELSEKRASKVINYLQQKCGWKPYRMLTPTGMATADPLASNDTEDERFQAVVVKCVALCVLVYGIPAEANEEPDFEEASRSRVLQG